MGVVSDPRLSVLLGRLAAFAAEDSGMADHPAVQAAALAVTPGLIAEVMAVLLAHRPGLRPATARECAKRICWASALRSISSLSDGEAAEVLGVSRRTILRDRRAWAEALQRRAVAA